MLVYSLFNLFVLAKPTIVLEVSTSIFIYFLVSYNSLENKAENNLDFITKKSGLCVRIELYENEH